MIIIAEFIDNSIINVTDILNNLNTEYKNDNTHNDKPTGSMIANQSK